MAIKLSKKLFERGVSGDVYYRVVYFCKKPEISRKAMVEMPGLLFLHSHLRTNKNELDRSISYWRSKNSFDDSAEVFSREIQAAGNPAKAEFVRSLKAPPEPILSVLSRVVVRLAAAITAIAFLWTVFLNIFEKPVVKMHFETPSNKYFLRSNGISIPITMINEGLSASVRISALNGYLVRQRHLGVLSLTTAGGEPTADTIPIFARSAVVPKLAPWAKEQVTLEWQNDVKPGVYQIGVEGIARAGWIGREQHLSDSSLEIWVLGAQPTIDIFELRPLASPHVARLYGQVIIGDRLADGVVCTMTVSDEKISRLEILSPTDFNQILHSLPNEKRLRFGFDRELEPLRTFNLHFQLEQHGQNEWSRLMAHNRVELGCSPRN